MLFTDTGVHVLHTLLDTCEYVAQKGLSLCELRLTLRFLDSEARGATGFSGGLSVL